MPTPAPDVGGVPDWLGMAGMGWSLRTSAHGSLTVGYRGGKPLRHPTFATDKPAHPALSALTSSSSSLQGIVQASLPSALALFVSFHCALHLNPVEKVLCAFGWWLGTDGVCGSAYGILRCNRVSACCAAPTPDRLFTASAQCSVKPVPQRLCRASGTLSAVNRLVLHSHSLQAQCSRCARGCRWR